MFIVEDKINLNNIEQIVQGYYDFFSRMYGLTRNANYIDYYGAYYNPSLIDLKDHNMIQTMDTIKSIDENDAIQVVSLYSEESGEFYAMARFRIKEKELIINDIIFLKDESIDRRYVIYMSLLAFLETHAESLGIETVFVEVSKRDTILTHSVEETGYNLTPEYNPESKRVTNLYDKKLPKRERVEDYGRYLNRKQTQESN